MGFSSKALVFFLVSMIAAASSSMAETYNVGDASGWTIMADVNYNEWASSETFHVGDTIRFVYSPEYHNVLQVTASDYESCTATAPLATYATGNDSIPIMGDDDHYYFICGVPGHCEMGQKVDIQVAESTVRAAQAPAISPPSAPTLTPPPPSKSSASYLLSSSLLVGLVGAATYLISMY